MRRITRTKSGINLSDWDETQKSIPEGQIFGVWLRKTDPQEWDVLMRMYKVVLDSKFEFLKEWALDNDDVIEHAKILLAGGIIAEHNLDYRIASVFAANLLIDNS